VNSRQYCVIVDPVDDKGVPQLGRKKVVRGEKSFFLMPGERLEKGIQDIYVLGENEGLIMKAADGFRDGVICYIILYYLLATICSMLSVSVTFNLTAVHFLGLIFCCLKGSQKDNLKLIYV
jgi:hypothetical protein